MAKIVHTNVGVGIETLAEYMSGDMHELTEGEDIIISNPPSGFHKVYNISAEKVGNTYKQIWVIEDEPEP